MQDLRLQRLDAKNSEHGARFWSLRDADRDAKPGNVTAKTRLQNDGRCYSPRTHTKTPNYGLSFPTGVLVKRTLHVNE